MNIGDDYRKGTTIHIKPLSINCAFKGRRFKTDEYKAYERAVLFMLPKMSLPEPPYKITLDFGLSNVLSDFDNPVKLFVDILQKKYLFNDKLIMEANIKKIKVEKGKEFVNFNIESL